MNINFVSIKKRDLKMLTENISINKEIFLVKESDLELLQRKLEKYMVQLKEFQVLMISYQKLVNKMLIKSS